MSKPIATAVICGKPRSDLRGAILSRGYEIRPVLSSRATLILCADHNPEASLLREARERGLLIINETDIEAAAAPPGQLWVDKYRPSSMSAVIGNQSEIKGLCEWLASWPAKGVAALITGPPGIGKTSAAHLVAKELGYSILEYNASDARSASAIDKIFGGAGASHGVAPATKYITIMDEVDGMSGSDRGGIGALAAVIKKGTARPIICIANDRGTPKLKPLTSCCFEVKFSRPHPSSITKIIMGIVEKEGVTIDNTIIMDMCKANGNDIRSIINSLQAIAANAGRAGVKDSLGRYDAFSATYALFNGHRSLSYSDAEQLAYVDYSMIPLMVQEAGPAAAGSSLEAVVAAAELCSGADLIDAKIHREQAWNMLPMYIAHIIGATKTAKTSPGPHQLFPRWLGKNSKYLKHMRQISEIAKRRCGSVTDLRLDLWSNLNVMASAMKPVEFAGFMRSNKFSRDDYFETLMETSFDPVAFSTKDKSAITREWNSGKKKRKGVRSVEDAGLGQDAAEEYTGDFSDDDMEYPE